MSNTAMTYQWHSLVLALCLGLALSGCAQNFPRPLASINDSERQQGIRWFDQTFKAHGGDHIDKLNDVNVAIDGEWKFLITRIQPLVTDHRYRVKSEERVLLQPKIYAAKYEGPDGSKTVFRNQNTGKVMAHYNGKPNQKEDVRSSTALTADSFYLFLLGPLALDNHRDQFVYLERCSNDTAACIYLSKTPGLGFSERDEVVLWVNRETLLTERVAITLEGHETTKRAHVDVRYDSYLTRGDFTFPSVFFERVLAPIKIDAHAWQLTGLDINRDLRPFDVETSANSPDWSEQALIPASPLTP